MANRSYLYALDFDPSERQRTPEDKIVSIGEWSWEVPMSHKLLLTGNPRPVPSLIFDFPSPMAYIGDYSTGLDHLYDLLTGGRNYLERYYDPAYLEECAQQIRAAFADKPEKKYFLLEPTEIFDLNDSISHERQHAALLQELRSQKKLFAWFTAAIEDEKNRDTLLGLDYWPDMLYYNFP